MGKSIVDVNCPVVMPYYGGKFTMSKRLIEMIPPHSRYIEVFAGGASMFFRKEKVEWNVLNDLDNDIVNLYICVVKEFEELKRHIYWYPKSRTLFDEFSENIKEGKIDIPNPERAAQYFFIVNNSFNSMLGSSFSKDSKKNYNINVEEELRLSRNKLNNVTIENFDFRDLITRYSPRKEDFWYLDPPYVVAKKGYYRNVFDEQSHIDLKESVDSIDKGGAHFMVSYDDEPEIRELYKDYDIKTIDTKYSGTTPEKRKEIKTELVIVNYEPKEQVQLF